jgi:hypothetical protein
MYLVMHDDGFGKRVWKGFDQDTLNRLHNNGYISYPKTKNKGLERMSRMSLPIGEII